MHYAYQGELRLRNRTSRSRRGGAVAVRVANIIETGCRFTPHFSFASRRRPQVTTPPDSCSRLARARAFRKGREARATRCFQCRVHDIEVFIVRIKINSHFLTHSDPGHQTTCRQMWPREAEQANVRSSIPHTSGRGLAVSSNTPFLAGLSRMISSDPPERRSYDFPCSGRGSPQKHAPT